MNNKQKLLWDKDLIEQYYYCFNIEKLNNEDNDGQTALTKACCYYPNWAIELINHNEININRTDKLNRTPLMLCYKYKNEHIAPYLLKQPNIDVNKQGKNGFNALVEAIQVKSQFESVKPLIDHPDIEINQTGMMGITPFMWACAYNTELAQYLFEYTNVDINIQDRMGYTALMYAAEKNHELFCYLLLESDRHDYDCNIDVENSDGKKVHDIAWEENIISYQFLKNFEQRKAMKNKINNSNSNKSSSNSKLL